MKFLIRFLKLLVVAAAYLVLLPFTTFMWFAGIYIVIPLGCVLYIITGECEHSFNRAMDFCFETLWCEIGLAPEIFISEKLLNEETY